MDKIKKKTFSTIGRLSKYFKTDLFYLVKGESYLATGKIIASLAAFLTALIWANLISKEIYGSYQYILSIVAIVSIFSLPGINTAIAQAVSRKIEGSFIKGFKIQIKYGLLGSIALLGTAGYYWINGNTFLPIPLIIVAILFPIFNASLLYINFLNGRRLFKTQIQYDAITQTIAMIVMVSVLFFINKYLTDASKLLILILTISTYYISRTSLRLFFFNKTKKELKPNSKEDSKTIPYGKHLTYAGVLGFISDHLDNILLFHYLGTVQLAIYVFATLVPKQIKVFLGQISTLMFPKLTVRPREELRKTFLKKVFYLTGIITLIVIVYIIVAPWIYKFFFPEYLESIYYSRLYALSSIPLCFSVISLIFKSKMMTKQVYQIRTIGPIVKILLSVLLIPTYGILGAVLSVIFARTFNVFIYLILFKKV